jgi:hypothetical protein
MLKIASYISLFILLSALAGCINDAHVDQTKELKFGDSVSSTTMLIPVSGGTIFSNIKDQNTPRAVFAANTFGAAKTVTISDKKISGSTFGFPVSPVSDLVTVDFGSAFAGNDVQIGIPVDLDTNNFTMAFLYNPVTFELEGLPTVNYTLHTTPKIFWVTTRHSGSIFLSSIPKSKLAGSVSSSFDPAKDNWEFPNFPTALTPSGQFAGQTLSAFWYYYEQTLTGKSHLYGLFDIDHGGEPPKIWQDNDLGFRVAAETQQASNWAGYSFAMIAPINNGNISLTSSQIIYSMMVTGKPQLITVVKDSTVIPLIVYKESGGQMFVADPNLPIAENQTVSSTQSSSGYTTALSMYDLNANKTLKFSGATYIGVRAMLNWDMISGVWDDAQKNLFYTFKPYTITFSDKSGKLQSTANGFLSLFDTITYNISGNPSSVWVYQNNNFSAFTTTTNFGLKPGLNQFNMYFQNQSSDNTHSVWAGFSTVNIQKQTFSINPSLDSGFVENDVTLHAFMGSKPTESLRYEWDMGDGSPLIKNTNVDSIKYRYQKAGTYTVTLSIYQVSSNTLIGTERSTVVISLNPAVISQSEIPGITGIPYDLYGSINVPKDIIQRCEWSMGDASQTLSIIGNDTIKYAYQNPGTYTITLNFFDNATNAFLGSGNTTVTVSRVELPTLAQLQSMKYIQIGFSADNVYAINASVSAASFSDAGGTSSDTSSQRIIWTGEKFTAQKIESSSSKYDNSQGWGNESYQYNNTINGEISSDNSFLASIAYTISSYQDQADYSKAGGWGQDETRKETENFSASSIFLSYNSNDTLIYQYVGPSLKDHVKGINWNYNYSVVSNTGHTQLQGASYQSTNWNNPNIPPALTIIFHK